MFKTADGVDILISIQSDREWRVLAAQVLGDAALAADPAFATNVARVKRRADTDAKVQAMFGATDADALTQKLAQADIAFARVNDTATLAAHPQLRRIEVATPVGAVSFPPRPRAATARPGATARCLRWASTAMRSAPSSCRARNGRTSKENRCTENGGFPSPLWGGVRGGGRRYCVENVLKQHIIEGVLLAIMVAVEAVLGKRVAKYYVIRVLTFYEHVGLADRPRLVIPILTE